MSDPNMSSEQHAYWEGVASRQDEVDKLQVEIDELKKRIELVLRLIKNKDCLNYLDKIETTLKGENNE